MRLAPVLVSYLCLLPAIGFAEANVPMVPELSPAAHADLKWFRAVGQHHVDHGSDTISRTRRAPNEREVDVLEQAVAVNKTLHMFSFEIGGTPSLGQVTRLAQIQDGGPPAFSPWILVTRSESTATSAPGREPTSAGGSWWMSPGRVQSWRARHFQPREEEQIVAVGERVLIGQEDAGPQMVRVQKHFRLSSMNQRITVDLGPVDSDGRARAVMVNLNGVTGEFRLDDLVPGEIIGLRAAMNTLFITTTARITYHVAIHSFDGGLGFELLTRRDNASEDIKVTSAKRSARERPATKDECAELLKRRY